MVTRHRLIIDLLCLFVTRDARAIIYSLCSLRFTRNLRFMKEFLPSNLWRSLWIVYECWARHVTRLLLLSAFVSSTRLFRGIIFIQRQTEKERRIKMFSHSAERCFFYFPSLKRSLAEERNRQRLQREVSDD